MESIEDRIRKMMVERLFLQIKPEEIEIEASLMENYGVDSVQVAELVVGTEAEFDISFEDDDFDPTQFETVKQIADLVRSKMDSQ